MPISFRPSEQVKGGLVGDVDAVLTRIRMESDIYQNGTPSIGAVGILTLDGGDTDRVLWSLGSPQEWEILNPETVTEDGREFLRGIQVDSVKGHTGSTDSANVSMLMREMQNAGFPANKITDVITCIEGVKCHWIRKPQPKRSGLDQPQQGQPQQGEGRERTVLVPEKVLLMPGEKAKGGTAARPTVAPGASGKTTVAPATDPLENELAVGIASAAVAILKATKAGAVPKSKWVTTRLAAASKADGYPEADKPTKDAVGELLKNAEWLGEFGIKIAADSGDVTIEA